MGDLLSKFTSGELIGLVAVVGGLICGTVWVIAYYWYEMRRTETDAALKQEMLGRGMSAEDIQTVLEAGSGERPRSSRSRHVCRG
jgi:hypothetical protein